MQPAKMLVLMTLFAALIGTSVSTSVQKALLAGPRSIANNKNSDTQPVNIAFDVPDLAVTIETVDGHFELEGFKSTSNDKILQDATHHRTSELVWVSIGMPQFVMFTNLNNPNITRLFQSSHDGFYGMIEMLTEAHRKILVARASAKYRVNITEDQITNLVLASFTCRLKMQKDVSHSYWLKGIVSDYRRFPLRMDFKVNPTSPEHTLFSDILNDARRVRDLTFDCRMQCTGKDVLTNTLRITVDQQTQIGFDEKLFGKSGSSSSGTVFVTRDQMTALSSATYSTLNIVTDYDMIESAFSEAFIAGMIQQLATGAFQQVDTDAVLASISKYRLDVSGDVKADVIKHELKSMLKVQKYGNVSRIVLDEQHYQSLLDAQSSSGGASAGFQGCGIGVEFSAHWAKSNSQENTTQTKSLNDQLKSLNSASHDEARWEFDGEKVIPKSLNVARLSRAKLSKDLKFSRVQITKTAAAFDRKFGIYTGRPSATISFLDQLSARIDKLNETLNSTAKSLESLIADRINFVVNQTKLVQSQLQSQIANQINQLYSQLQSQISSTSSDLHVYADNINNALTTTINKIDSHSMKSCKLCLHLDDGTQPETCWYGYKLWYGYFKSGAHLGLFCDWS